MSMVGKFERRSGMKINIKKSAIIFMGKNWDLGRFFDMETKEQDRYLGIDIVGRKGKKVAQPAVERYFKAVEDWSGRKWNIFLKVKLVRACVLGKLAFVSPFLNMSEVEKKKVESGYARAIWGKEIATRMRKEQAWNGRDSGGLGTVDV